RADQEELLGGGGGRRNVYRQWLDRQGHSAQPVQGEHHRPSVRPQRKADAQIPRHVFRQGHSAGSGDYRRKSRTDDRSGEADGRNPLRGRFKNVGQARGLPHKEKSLAHAGEKPISRADGRSASPSVVPAARTGFVGLSPARARWHFTSDSAKPHSSLKVSL